MLYKNILGCIIGGAIGDAMGMPFEDMPETIREKTYGKSMIKEMMTGKPYMLRREIIPAGSVTDDTEMVLCTIDSINNENAIKPKKIADSLLSWLQREQAWLKGDAQNIRIGTTTRSALNNYYRFRDIEKSGVESSGCGAAIRISPIAVSLYNDFEKLKEATIKIAQITHKNKDKQLAEDGALCVAYTIRYILLKKSVDGIIDYLKELIRSKEFQKNFEFIKLGLEENWEPKLSAYSIGVGDQCLATDVVCMALYLFIRNKENYENTIIEAINITHPVGVDTDSIAGIAGAFSGCYLGEDKIPEKWKKIVMYREEIKIFTKTLYEIIEKNKGKVPFIENE